MNEKEKVNLLIGRFQPMTSGHYKCMEYIYKNYNKRKTVICMIEVKEGKTDPEKRPFPTDVFINHYKNLLEVGKENSLVIDILKVNSADIVKNKELFESFYGSKYEIASWSCGSDRFNDYNRMASKYTPEIQVIEIPRTDEDVSATKARIALKENNEKLFMNLFLPLKTIRQQLYFKTNNILLLFEKYLIKP